jgi:hypothetical protein
MSFADSDPSVQGGWEEEREGGGKKGKGDVREGGGSIRERGRGKGRGREITRGRERVEKGEILRVEDWERGGVGEGRRGGG